MVARASGRCRPSAGWEPVTTSNRRGPNDGKICDLRHRRVRCVDDAAHGRAGLLCIAHGAQRIRRAAAGGDADDDIAGVQIDGFEVARADLGVVLRALDGMAQGMICRRRSTRPPALDRRRRSAGIRRRRARPAGRWCPRRCRSSRPSVVIASTIRSTQRGDHRKAWPNRIRHQRILPVDDRDDLQAGHPVDIHRIRGCAVRW